MSAHAAPADPRAVGRRVALPRVGARTLGTLGFGAGLAAVALGGGGGLQLGPLTAVEIALLVVAGVAGAAAILVGERGRRLDGAIVLGLCFALVALTALSTIWAVAPADALVEANRTLAWVATLALGVALVRLWPGGWSALLGGVLLAALAVCGFALATKVLPGALAAQEPYARLREPFGYWNSVGLVAAMGVPACLWLGARRSGRPLLDALALPALGLLVATCMMAFSRGALLALAIGCALWFLIVPLRLRAAALLALGGGAGALVGMWAFTQDALSTDRIAVADRNAAGLELGLLVAVMAAVLWLAGLAIGFVAARRPLSPRGRRRAGAAVLVAVALVPVGVAGTLANSERGLTGSVSKAWSDLTDPDARTPPNDPTRLTAIGSVRARYWDEALKIFSANEALGVGAGGYRVARWRYRINTLSVRHAHGYAVQTLADLGLTGLLLSVALLVAWLAAAVRATGPWFGRARGEFTPERIGLLTMCAVVVVFGAHSLIDWTWFVPGNVVPALLCAGWVAGRGRPAAPEGAGARPAGGLRAAVRDPRRAVPSAAVLALALIAAWVTWQPVRAVAASDEALAALEDDRVLDARDAARRAHEIDPLALQPLFVAATVESAAGEVGVARRFLQEAVRLQPSNSEPWLRLARFELGRGRPETALRALGPALYLDPLSPPVKVAWLDAGRAAAATP